MAVGSRAAWVFVLAASACLAAQTMLLAERQCRRLEGVLGDDFRVVFFLPVEISDSRAKLIEEKLLAQPEAAAVRYVSAAEALSTLKREDPELMDAVALVGDNPLPGSFEVQPSVDSLPRLASWIGSIQTLTEWSDVRWKPAQLQAILRARLYGHWLRLVLSTLFCAAALLALWALAVSVRSGRRGEASMAAAGALGGAAGLAIAVLWAWPLRRDELLWSWPSLWAQGGVIVSCAVLGWALSSWRCEP